MTPCCDPTHQPVCAGADREPETLFPPRVFQNASGKSCGEFGGFLGYESPLSSLGPAVNPSVLQTLVCLASLCEETTSLRRLRVLHVHKARVSPLRVHGHISGVRTMPARPWSTPPPPASFPRLRSPTAEAEPGRVLGGAPPGGRPHSWARWGWNWYIPFITPAWGRGPERRVGD